MLKAPSPQQFELEMVTLDELVPKDHLVRKVDAAIDFEFIRDRVAHLYCPDNGRPPIDPVRLFKAMLLGYLFGVRSERQLIKDIQVNVAYRWFLRMSLTEKVFDASTFSQNRRRRFNDKPEIYLGIFENIVEQAMTKGLVGGRVLHTDSTHLKASANRRKVDRKEVEVAASAYLETIDSAVMEDRAQRGKKPLKSTTDSSKTKIIQVSRTDPDAGVMHRDQKPVGPAYLDHRTVDGLHGIIVDSYATGGNVNDAQPYIARLDYAVERFKLNTVAVAIDAGYFIAPICHLLELRNIQGAFGYRRPNHSNNEFKKRDFEYDKEGDAYRCPANQILSYTTTSRLGYREYRNNSACQHCLMRDKCTKSKTSGKVITRHVFEDAKERANTFRITPEGRKLYRRRGEVVERSFADAKQHHGHRYARYRGLSNMQMQCWFAAAAQNIKKIALVEWRKAQAALLRQIFWINPYSYVA